MNNPTQDIEPSSRIVNKSNGRLNREQTQLKNCSILTAQKRMETMKALVYHGPGKRAWEEKPKPAIKEPTDAIVRISKTTICGTDLHILKGDVPEVTDGRVLGHEGVGIIEEVGGGVANFRSGDKVLISCITSCGKCESGKKGMYSHYERGGGLFLRDII